MTIQISTYEELQSRLEEIADAVTNDFRLAVAAASNPLFALRELGYELEPRVAAIVEERARHRRGRREKLREARKQVEAAAGQRVDLDSTVALDRLLNGELGLGVPAEALKPLPFRWSRLRGASPPDLTYGQGAEAQHDLVVVRRERSGERSEQPEGEQHLDAERDPLAAYSDAHPVVAPLLTYRALQAVAPPLADEALYSRVRSGDIDPPLTSLRVRRAGSDEVVATAERR